MQRPPPPQTNEPAAGPQVDVTRRGGPPPPQAIAPLTIRLLVIGALLSLIVQTGGLVGGKEDLLVDSWPEVLAISVALVWTRAGINDFAVRLHLRLPTMIKEGVTRHPFPWFRFYLRRVVGPVAQVFAYVIPGSMLLIAGSYLTGIAVVPAAAGAVFLLVNMALFTALQRERDAFLVLFVTQGVIIATNPGGIPNLIDIAT